MKFKKSLALIIVVVMIFTSLSSLVNAKSVTFDDVKETEWFYFYVTAMADRGLVSGTGDGKFSPQNPVTREQFCKFIVNSLVYDETIATKEIPIGMFTDVPVEGNWAAEFVETAAKNNLVTGRGEGIFDPKASITRQEMAIIMAKAYCLKHNLVLADDAADVNLPSYGFTDIDLAASWALNGIKVALKHSIMQGSDGKLDPIGLVTRAQTATVCCRLIGLEKGNKTALIALISDATTNQNTTSVGTAEGNVPQLAMDTFVAAIAAASAVKDDAAAVQSTVDAAVTTLNAAIAAFNAAKVVLSVDKDALIAAILAANTNNDTTSVGTAVGNVPQEAKDTFTAAIADATAVKNDTAALQATVDDAVIALNDAIGVFDASKVPPLAIRSHGTQIVYTAEAFSVPNYPSLNVSEMAPVICDGIANNKKGQLTCNLNMPEYTINLGSQQDIQSFAIVGLSPGSQHVYFRLLLSKDNLSYIEVGNDVNCKIAQPIIDDPSVYIVENFETATTGLPKEGSGVVLPTRFDTSSIDPIITIGNWQMRTVKDPAGNEKEVECFASPFMDYKTRTDVDFKQYGFINNSCQFSFHYFMDEVVQAQYVKIIGYGNSMAQWYMYSSFTEIQIYGPDATGVQQ